MQDQSNRDRAHQALETALDLLKRHHPSGGEQTANNKDAAMRTVIKHLDKIAEVFTPAINHVFNAERIEEADRDSHELEKPPPTPGVDSAELYYQRVAIAKVLYLLPHILPQPRARMLAGALYLLNEGDQHPILERKEIQGHSLLQGLADIVQPMLPRHVWYRMGRYGENKTRAREHYAELVGIEPSSVARWDKKAERSDLELAKRLGAARKRVEDGTSQDSDTDQPIKPEQWIFYEDDQFKWIFNYLKFNRRGSGN